MRPNYYTRQVCVVPLLVAIRQSLAEKGTNCQKNDPKKKNGMESVDWRKCYESVKEFLVE